MSTAIKFENISKQYRLGLVSTKTISHDLNRWWAMNIRGKEDPYLKIGETNDRAHKGSSDYVWALKDINFEVQQGDVLGIIGKNGAGKSTLLKILSKVTTPSTGSITAKGRIASLLEVGTGFHEELTGRENIYMNGAIMGMTKQEISRKLDEIVDFAGVERYLDTPVKRYSSGMTVRLGFSIAAHLDPEIMVVDEVLAVGDAEFQKKAIKKMQDVSKGAGRTVLFVSHNMGSVATLCKTGVILSKGSVSFYGTIDKAIDTYIADGNSESVYFGNHTLNSYYFKKVSLEDEQGVSQTSYGYRNDVQVCFEIGINKSITDATLSFTVLDSRLNAIFTSHQLVGDQEIFKAKVPAQFMLPGTYYIRPVLHVPNQYFLDTCDSDICLNIEDTGSDFSAYITNNELGSINAPIIW